MADRFEAFAASITGPATHAFTVTPHATNPLADVTRALWIGVGGNVTCRLSGSGSDVTFLNVPDGTLLPIRATHVRATSTASNIIGMV